jgi:hypothetical protein
MRTAAALSCGALLACASCVPAAPLPASPACPRDASLDGGRCACLRDRVLVLGACVEPEVRDAYCGPAALRGAGACAFRTCAEGEALDEGGRCIPIGAVARSGPPCEAPSRLVVTGGGRAACVPADAACPRGTLAAGDACRAPASCPAGALWTGQDCRSIVSHGPRGPVVDLGSWAAVALGASGGPGSPELCRPLASAPLAFDLSRGDKIEVRLAISVAVPDQDLSRVFASVRAAQRGAPDHPLLPAAEQRVDGAVRTMIEQLRGLGGESSTAAVQVEVRCDVSSVASATAASP